MKPNEPKSPRERALAAVHGVFELGFAAIVAIFFFAAVTLIVFSASELWGALRPAEGTSTRERFVAVLECIGLLTIAVASLELGQTILEEELQRSTAMSAPTRVRRFLSRFLVVVIVSLSIECLVAVFEYIHDAPERLIQASAIGVAAAAILAAWGFFVRMNIAAESLEPDAIRHAQAEDRKVEKSTTGADRDETDLDRPDQRPSRRSPMARPRSGVPDSGAPTDSRSTPPGSQSTAPSSRSR